MKSKDEINVEREDKKETVEVSQKGSLGKDKEQDTKEKPKQTLGSKKSRKKTASAKSKNDSKRQRKATEATGVSNLQSPANLVEVILREFINVQKVWFEISLQQMEMFLKLISGATGASKDSVDAVTKMMKENAENFIALQNEWAKILTKQSAETVGSLKHISGPSSYPAVFKRNFEAFLESISQMQNAWTEFLQKQSEQINETIKKSLGADEKSRIVSVTSFADSVLKNILEAQRRWLEVATGLFSSDKPSDRKK